MQQEISEYIIEYLSSLSDRLQELLDRIESNQKNDENNNIIRFQNINKNIELNQSSQDQISVILQNAILMKKVQREQNREYKIEVLDCDQFEQKIRLDIEIQVDNKISQFKEIVEYMIISELIQSIQTQSIDGCIRIQNQINKNVLLDVKGIKVDVEQLDTNTIINVEVNSLSHNEQPIDIVNREQMVNSVVYKNRDNQIQYKKYDRFQNEKPKLPDITEQSINNLIDKMDYDQDGKISIQDIQQFCQFHFLDIDSQIIKQIFDDCTSVRYYKNDRNIRQYPLDKFEINQNVKFRNKRTETGWIQVEKPYRKYWVLFLKTIGEKIVEQNMDHKPEIQEICDIEQEYNNQLNRFHKEYKSKKMFSMTIPIKKKVIESRKRYEAGIDFESTLNIHRENNDYVIYQNPQSELINHGKQFEKITNARFENQQKDQDDGFRKISFDTQEYFKESMKLSMDPITYKEKNPITKYVPSGNYEKRKNPQYQDEENQYSSRLSNYAPRVSQIFNQSLQVPKEFKVTEKQRIKQSYNFGQSLHHVIREERMLQKATELQNKRLYNLQEQQDLKMFNRSFMPEKCISLKIKLAQNEYSNNGQYINPSNHKFRDDYIYNNKSPFKVHNKLDSKDKYVFLRDQEKELSKQQQTRVDDDETIRNQWYRFFKPADLTRNFVDHKYPDFLDKGAYTEPIDMNNNLFTEETNIKTQFQLYHRPLQCDDKSKFFGENYNKLDRNGLNQ